MRWLYEWNCSNHFSTQIPCLIECPYRIPYIVFFFCFSARPNVKRTHVHILYIVEETAIYITRLNITSVIRCGSVDYGHVYIYLRVEF